MIKSLEKILNLGSLQEEFQLLREMEPEQAFKQSTSVIQFLSDFYLETFEE